MKYYETLDRIEGIKTIEKETGRKIITFYRNALNNQGIIDESVYREFRTAIDSIGSYDPLTVIIHTMGGYTYFGWRIASCLMNRNEPTVVIVPEEALSMGTMITLAADEIVMLPKAHLSPVDPQLDYNGTMVPALDLLDSPEQLVRARAKRSIELAEENLRQLCKSKLSEPELDALVKRLLLKDKKHAAHASSIFFDELNGLGLNVKEQVLDNVNSLHRQYKRHSFNQLDPCTIIEYIRDSLPKDKTSAWERIRAILESYKSDKHDLDKTQELLKFVIETDLTD